MSVVEKAYLSKVRECLGECAFRGQADSSWGLHSSAARRLISYFNGDENVTKARQYPRIYAAYHRAVLLEPAREQGLGNDAGQPMSDLQLLTKLQQNGAATGLIDFSWDPLVALWFACGGNNGDGRVFVLDLGDRRNFRRMPFDEVANSVEDVFVQSDSDRKQFFFEATAQGDGAARVLRQRGVFVIGRPTIPDEAVKTIEISESDKEKIREELEADFGISERTLFSDVQGFSSANNVQAPLREIEDEKFRWFRGNQFWGNGDYYDAITLYDRCIELDGDWSEAYYQRGNAKAEVGEFREAREDYDMSLQFKERLFEVWKEKEYGSDLPALLWPIFYNRGNVRAASEDYIGAREDYDEAIRLMQRTNRRVSALYYNRGNAHVHLGSLDDADRDFREAIDLGNDYALYNRGNLHAASGDFEEAIQCYDELIWKGNDRIDPSYNRTLAEEILKRIDESDIRVHTPRYEGPEQSKTIEIEMEASGVDGYKEYFNFGGDAGNAGNAGNLAESGLPGGKGYMGEDGFVVILHGQGR